MTQTASLEVRSAKHADKTELAALMQDYLAEFATFESVQQDADGHYVYPYFDHYWEDPNRYPFLFRVDGESAGFALLRFELDPVNGQGVMHMAEFFVARPYRRRGIGTRAATRLWDLFPGHWRLNVLRSNKNAYPFWRQVIGDYTNNEYVEQAPIEAVGGAFTFSFMSASDADMPDDLDPETVDF